MALNPTEKICLCCLRRRFVWNSIVECHTLHELDGWDGLVTIVCGGRMIPVYQFRWEIHKWRS